MELFAYSGTNLKWNTYIIDETKRDLIGFRKLAQKHPEFHEWLKESYINVKDLLLDRLGPTWQSHDEIALIINEVLKE